ncbi:MAG TPA: amino acid adenylation domain-containing protein, partial [Thermoanaerobaculia bacterium]|nr:amino acid adenylation domain-containing protein [Thermoanaerobaculia bacterium]
MSPPREETLAGLFEAQARRTPEAEALVAGALRWSYRELDRRAGRLAGRLAALGVGPEVRVGICLGRKAELVAAILGVLKAGGAYVPLDPAYPEERLRFLLEDSAAAVVLSEEALVDRLAGLGSRARILCLDREEEGEAPVGEPERRAESGNLAYLIYTSGSTGRPKGVAIEHRSAVALVDWALRSFPAGELAGMLASTSINFDLSVFELFVPLSSGGKVILAANALELPALPAASEVTFVNTVPSAMTELVRSGGVPRSVLAVGLAGEPLPRPLAERIHGLDTVRRLYNLYGPSEDTTYSTWTAVLPGEDGPPSIGVPLDGTRAWLLDPAGEPVAEGELFLAGDGLARGYLGRPELTAERFVPDPFADRPGERLYRTGDLARLRPDGGLDFLGRLDHQVKIRGFRIELGEIETWLGRHPGVGQSLVVAREDREGDRRLVAYVVPREGADAPVAPAAHELRDFLREKLPAHMVPSAFVRLDAFPLTPNGKIDRKALPAPDRAGADRGPFVAPRTGLEREMAALWSEVLGLGAEAGEVGVEDDFFALGGHSLHATQVLSRVRDAWGAELAPRRLFEAPTVAGLAAAVEEARRAGTDPEIPPLTRFPREPWMPPSFAQERLWLVEQLEPGTATYNVPVAMRFSGPLDSGILVRGLNEVVRRHEALRTALVPVDGSPRQVIAPELVLDMPVTDLSAMPAGEREETAGRLAGELAREPFDLARLPLLRAHLFRIDREEHLLLLNLHHVISDDWSIWLLARELGTIYRAFRAGEPSPLPELPVQYPDFALWQRGWLRGEILARQLDYWRRQLANPPAALELPTDRARPKTVTFTGKRYDFKLPGDLARSLSALSRRQGATPFMSLLAAFGVQLGRMSGQDDVLIGYPIANRNRADVEELIGFFTNTLVLRVGLADRPGFRALLARTREAAIEASAHQDLPFEGLVADLKIERNLSRLAFFQVMFALQNAPRPPRQIAPGLTSDARELDTGTAKVDLSLLAWETDEGLDAALEYNTDLFDESSVARMAAHFEVLLGGILADPGRPVSELPLLTGAERRQLLFEWNDTGSPPAWEGPLGALFDRQAERTPDAVAVELGEDAVSYRDLARRTDRLAHRLRALGVGPEVLVGLCAERSVQMIEGLLAIWKAGGVCVPINPAYPRERLAFLLADTEVPVLVTQERLAGALPPHQARTVLLEDGGEALDGPAGGVTGAGLQPGNLAYVVYTSGSTGRPKGVGVSHGAMVTHCAAIAEFYGFGPSDRVLQFSVLSFDTGLEQAVPPLFSGATLVLRGEDLWGAEETLERFAALGITVADLPPPLWHQIVARLGDGPVDAGRLRLVTAGGDAMVLESALLWQRSSFGAVALANGYGPTESVITSTFFRVPPDLRRFAPGALVPLGRPLPGRTVYLLDRDGQPVPAGVPGEVYLGDPVLARGYHHLPALTAERFVPDPWSGMAGARLYRSGDLARWLRGGALDFLGRVDRQIKVRGFRIEPGEIEAVLGRHPAVREAVVKASDAAGGKRLVGYVVGPSDGGQDLASLRELLHAELPDHMVPAALVVLPELPLTPNGKVDLRALPEPDLSSREEGYEPPRNPVEEILAEIWAGLLGVERVGIRDNFFALGGHSLLATQVMSRIRKLLGADLPLRRLFERPTVAGLAEAVHTRASEADGAPPLVPVPRGAAALPLSFAQERLWFLEQLEPGSPAYNIPAALRLAGDLDVAALKQSLGEAVRRHEILRTRLVEVEKGRAGQAIDPPGPAGLPVIDLSGLPPCAREEEAGRRIAADAVRPFDLGRSLLHASLLRLDRREHALLLNLHHAAADGWSLRLLLDEMAAFYKAAAAGSPARLPGLPIQYADFAVWQRQWLEGEVLASQLAYWRKTLAGSPPVLDLPADRPRPALLSQRGSSVPITWPAELARGLGRMARAEGATLFMALLAGFQALLSRSTRQEDLTVGTPIAGRNRIETESLIGLFVNTLVLRTDLSGDPPFRTLMSRVREVTLGAYAHQDLPFEKLVQELHPERSLSHTPLFQVFLALQNTGSLLPAMPGLELRGDGRGTGTAKFELTLALEEDETGLDAVLEYSTDRFDRATALRLLEHLGTLLAGAAADPGLRLSELPVLGAAEREQLLAEWGAGRALAPREETLAGLFEAQARRTPEA